MIYKLTECLGQSATDLQSQPPFSGWAVERRVFQEDLPEPRIHYVFVGQGLEFGCDPNDRIGAIFLTKEADQRFLLEEFGLSFSSSRRHVAEVFGSPEKSGEKLDDPILGTYGAWDRFASNGYAAHVQYRLDSDAIEMVTLMLPGFVP